MDTVMESAKKEWHKVTVRVAMDCACRNTVVKRCVFLVYSLDGA